MKEELGCRQFIYGMISGSTDEKVRQGREEIQLGVCEWVDACYGQLGLNPPEISLRNCVECISELSHQMVSELKHPIPINRVWPLGDINSTAFPGWTCLWVNSGGRSQKRKASKTSTALSSSPNSLSIAGSTHYPSSSSEDFPECPCSNKCTNLHYIEMINKYFEQVPVAL